MAEGDKEKKPAASELERGVGLSYLKDLTLAIMQLRQVVGASIDATADNVEGLAALRESIDSLDHHIVGIDFMLSRFSFAFDKMVEIRRGKPGDEKAEGRAPDWDDFAAAMEEFDKEMEKEQEKAEQEDGREGEKPPMLSNSPAMTKKLPPRPVMASKPK